MPIVLIGQNETEQESFYLKGEGTRFQLATELNDLMQEFARSKKGLAIDKFNPVNRALAVISFSEKNITMRGSEESKEFYAFLKIDNNSVGQAQVNILEILSSLANPNDPNLVKIIPDEEVRKQISDKRYQKTDFIVKIFQIIKS